MIATPTMQHQGEDERALVVCRIMLQLGRGCTAMIWVKIITRHAVADAAVGDQLAQPHDDRGAGGHDDDHRGDRED